MSVVASFDQAAARYDASADIQATVAAALLARADSLSPRSILDIGCGTGLLTALAQRRWPQAAITAIDAAPAMLAEAGAKLPAVRFLEGDAARLDLAERYDLVLSSMVLHWLDKPDEVLAHWRRLLAPGGALHVAVPVDGSLREWKEHCARHGVAARLWRFPRPETVGGEIRQHTLVYPTARAFLLAMKHTGAATPDPAAPAMPHLRMLLKAAPRPFPVTFAIAYL